MTIPTTIICLVVCLVVAVMLKVMSLGDIPSAFIGAVISGVITVILLEGQTVPLKRGKGVSYG